MRRDAEVASPPAAPAERRPSCSDQPWQGGTPLGNIHRQSFESIWHGAAWQQLRAQHRARSLGPVCRRCPAAGIGSPDDAAAFVER